MNIKIKIDHNKKTCGIKARIKITGIDAWWHKETIETQSAPEALNKIALIIEKSLKQEHTNP